MDVVQGAEDLSPAEKVTLAADAVVTLAELLRARDQDLPVLAISGRSDVEYRMRSLSGKAAFARKPFVAAELVASVGALVG
jgi:DNA-binding response OmpR family regulator